MTRVSRKTPCSRTRGAEGRPVRPPSLPGCAGALWAGLPRVKVCGLTRQDDVTDCARLGVHLAGFIFHAPSARNVAPARVADMDTGPMLRVGVFVRQTVAETVEIMVAARLHMAQLHGGQDVAFCSDLLTRLAESCGEDGDTARCRVLRAVWPARHATVAGLERELATFAPHAGGFVLDAGTSGGGHGTTLPWASFDGLHSPRPWLLAGGLGPDNVEQAVRAARPWGVDLNSGVESSPGIKDRQHIENALTALAACGTYGGPCVRIGDTTR